MNDTLRERDLDPLGGEQVKDLLTQTGLSFKFLREIIRSCDEPQEH